MLGRTLTAWPLHLNSARQADVGKRVLPLIALVPKPLIATANGEPNPEVEAEVLKEINSRD